MKKIYSLLFAILLVACKSDSGEETDPKITLDAEFYQNYYDLNIAPAVTNFKTELETELQYIQNFQSSQTDENYNAIVDQWLVCAKAYAKTQVYDFGEIENGFYDTNIYNFPIAKTSVESNIADATVFDTEYFSSKSTTTKGLGTMEYLIYADNNTSEAKNLLINDSYRLDYLLAVAQEVLRQTNLIISTWEDGYATTFVNLEGSSCTQNATCLTVNQLINILDVTKVTKIGKTAGFESTITVPENLEAFRSRSSLLLIQSMLEEVQKSYQNGETSFESVVDQIDDTGLISKTIDEKFTELENEITAFDNNLYDAILTDVSTIEPIYNTLNELTILFAVDVASTLSITVLPTDNDGD